MKKIHATLGFIFSKDLQEVLLIRKRHPEWQAGKINGLGGKCFEGESPAVCIAREVKEESCIDIPVQQWRFVTKLSWKEWDVSVFAAKYEGSPRDAETMTDEEVEWFPVNEVPELVIANLRWLIPLSVDQLTNPFPPAISNVSYPN